VDPQKLAVSVVEDWRRQNKDVMLGELSGSGTVQLRAQSIRRALENLISNAVRYGTRARVSVTLTEKSLRLRVEDDGPGIPAAQRGDAVRPFARLDPARNQDLGSGVGLGLAIVADIARAHGGMLRLGKSKELGGLQADIVIGR
jgi:two-component system osmolarity sensor histidine kinase EnvZ